MTGRGILPYALNHVIAFERQGQLWCGFPGRVSVKDVGAAIWSRPNRREAKAGLHWYGSAIRCYGSIRILLSEVIVDGPVDRLAWCRGEAEQLVLKSVRS